MQVFISSVITGFGPYRDAAVAAVRTLGYEAIRAEDFSASSQSPRQECLSAVRRSDAMVLLLGSSYGHLQQSGLSATHEEYREARDHTPVLAFVQHGANPGTRQGAFIDEVRRWDSGLLTATFTGPEDLQSKVTRALHDLVVNMRAMPVDTDEIANRAERLVPNTHMSSTPGLVVAVASGPHQTILRPSELNTSTLRRFLLAETLTGDHSVLPPTDDAGFSVPSTRISVRDGAIMVVQDDDRSVSLSGSGDLLINQPAENSGGWLPALPCLIEEEIEQRIANAFRFAAGVLAHIDGLGRLTHYAIAVGLRNAGYLPWRTRTEHQRSPNQATVGFPIGHDRTNLIMVMPSPPVQPRPALLAKAEQTAHDLMIKLRWHMAP